MDCPHCHQPLSAIEIETSDGHVHSIDECLNCGGHFLEPYLANFLTIETARNIDSVIPKSKAVPLNTPVCPKCGQIMPGIKDDAVPQTVTIFTCPNNHGDFFPKNQLLLFKEAQQSKIYYHKFWGIPLKSAFAVLIPILVIFSLATLLPSILQQVTSPQETRVKASDILIAPSTTNVSDTHVLIYFTTANPAFTTIKFTSGPTGIFQEADPTVRRTNHLISVDNLTPGTLYKYVIVIDTNGKPVTTSEYTFSTP